MKNITKQAQIFFLLLVFSKFGNAQDYNTYDAYDAVLLQVSGNTRIESRLKKAIIILSGSSQLNVRINIPYHPVNDITEDPAMLSDPGIPFDLQMTLNPWKAQNEASLSKVFSTQGLVTMNNITKAVRVEYIPIPSGPDQNGNFNLSMTIRFNASDFNIDTPYKNSHFIIKIGGATVNRG